LRVFVNKTFDMWKGNFWGGTLAIFRHDKEKEMLVVKPVVSEKNRPCTVMKATGLLNKYSSMHFFAVSYDYYHY
jgi:hypothetical protein